MPLLEQYQTELLDAEHPGLGSRIAKARTLEGVSDVDRGLAEGIIGPLPVVSKSAATPEERYVAEEERYARITKDAGAPHSGDATEGWSSAADLLRKALDRRRGVPGMDPGVTELAAQPAQVAKERKLVPAQFDGRGWFELANPAEAAQ